MDSIEELGLKVGSEVVAIIKASNVLFATAKIPTISARNQIEGTVVKVVEGAINGHVTIETDEGDRITGSITNEAIEELGLVEGGKAVAIVKATDVIVGVE
jgi:molybdate transport system regulatory protein